jgi:hypothetical protein
MAHDNLRERREFVRHLADHGLAFDGPLVRNVARAFGCSLSAIRVDIQAVGKAKHPASDDHPSAPTAIYDCTLSQQ